MIALDTNAIVRVLTDDDETQAHTVRTIITDAERKGIKILILSEVIIETVWVLESAYKCVRGEITAMVENLLSAPVFFLPDSIVIRNAIRQYENGGDFADLLIVGQAKKHQATELISFDKKLQKIFPDYVSEGNQNINPTNPI
jgi:predicted nucleic-acid-binding protein